jgi:long-chain acyl-CoA synthetase
LDRKGKIVALVYSEQVAELGMEAVQKTMQANLQVLNKQLPAYSKVSEVEVVEKEFEKTPKRSIKRFLYK